MSDTRGHMMWIESIVDSVVKNKPEGEIVVSSGVSPSGDYHVGTLREVMTAEVIKRELIIRGRVSRHIHVSDDLDVFRKVPQGLAEDYKQYLGRPLCDIPSPDDSGVSYADYYLSSIPEAAKTLNLQMEVLRAHELYRSGFFVEAIERSLSSIADIKSILARISGRELDASWSPFQILENGYLKNRQFVDIDTNNKEISYIDKNGETQKTKYDKGQVKLNWRIDWPARWAELGVDVEPFGRDHATKGGSYDTGVVIAREVFGVEPPAPIAYNFINRTGQTKKMSKSGGDTITVTQLLDILPPEIVWFFMIKQPPEKQLFFDAGPTLIKLFDDFSALIAKPDKSASEEKLLELCNFGIKDRTVSAVPFSHLVSSYQAALRDETATLEVIARTEYAQAVKQQPEIIKKELRFIDNWLQKHAPDDVKFELSEYVDDAQFSEDEKKYMQDLADKIEKTPDNADGAWFHGAIYEFKDSVSFAPKGLFSVLYRAIIDKESGPRAGWFLSMLDRDWLIARLRLQK